MGFLFVGHLSLTKERGREGGGDNQIEVTTVKVRLASKASRGDGFFFSHSSLFPSAFHHQQQTATKIRNEKTMLLFCFGIPPLPFVLNSLSFSLKFNTVDGVSASLPFF